MYKYRAPALTDVDITDNFWAPRIETTRTVTLPIEYEQCKKTGRIDAWKQDWKPGRPNRPHCFWDSDVAKWIEAAGYALAKVSDKALEKKVDRVIDLMAKAQQKDGYLNLYFTVVEPKKRWTDLRQKHELYSAGHLMEAAVAYYEGTGKRKLLDVMCRYADYIDSVFGRQKGKKRGYPGHEEIELALVKLYRATGNKKYLTLSKYFVDERGRKPHFFAGEADGRPADRSGYAYCQAHLPVREQTTAEGHSVRAAYLYAGMADIAAETNDKELLGACRRIWKNIVRKRMYITGGIGSTGIGERFTTDYDLPNDTAYAETCAAIALVLFAQRMLHATGDGHYANVMERALYNGVLSGISLDGRLFFYTNRLHVTRPMLAPNARRGAGRQKWFGCACCPPNIARILASLHHYVYSVAKKEILVNLYVQGEARLQVNGTDVTLSQKTDYPWNGKVVLKLTCAASSDFTLGLRIPDWCDGMSVKVNGEPVNLTACTRKSYARIRRTWTNHDRVEIDLPMPVERMTAHPLATSDAGRMALQRGPLVYCLEETDNCRDLPSVRIPRDSKLTVRKESRLLGGVRTLSARGTKRLAENWHGRLYGPEADKEEAITVKAVPYYAWANRRVGEMIVWVRQ